MKLVLLSLLVSSSAATLLCTASSSSLTIWCNQNCNAAGTPNCPSNICTCQVLSPSAASTPSQTRSRPPSASQTRSRPPSASQTRTVSLTPSPSKTTTVSASQTRTNTVTASPTRTSTVSSSQTKSRSASSSLTPSQTPTNTVAPSITQSPFPLGFSLQAFTSSPCTGAPFSVAVGAAHGECLPLGPLFYKISRASDLIVEIFRSATCDLSSRIDTDSTSCQVNCESHNIETLGQIFWSIQCINPTPSRTPSNTPSVSASQTRSSSNTASSTLTRSATATQTRTASSSASPTVSRSASQSITQSRSASSTSSLSGSITASPSVTPVSGTFSISTSFFSGSTCDVPDVTSTAIIGECASLTSNTFYRATGSSTGLTFRFFSSSDCSDASAVDTETASCNSVCERHFVTSPDTQFADNRWTIACTQQSASNSPVPTPSPTSSRAAIAGDFEVLVFLGSCDTDPVFVDAALFNSCRPVSSNLFFKANPLDAQKITVEFFTDSTCNLASRVDSEVAECGEQCARHFVSVGPDEVQDEFWNIACAA